MLNNALILLSLLCQLLCEPILPFPYILENKFIKKKTLNLDRNVLIHLKSKSKYMLFCWEKIPYIFSTDFWFYVLLFYFRLPKFNLEP